MVEIVRPKPFLGKPSHRQIRAQGNLQQGTPPPVEEHEPMPGEGVLLQLALHQKAKTVERATHVGGLRGEKHADRWGQAQHRNVSNVWSTSANNPRSTSAGNRKRQPLGRMISKPQSAADDGPPRINSRNNGGDATGRFFAAFRTADALTLSRSARDPGS
jgi:hypothetical protein